jgi:hypothetical protein
VDSELIRDKRAALAQEITIRARDFAVKCQSSRSYEELWWHRDEFEGAQNHLFQFRDASMDELTFQYGLLPGKQDKVVRERLDSADDKIYNLLVNWSGGQNAQHYYNELDAFKQKVKEIVCSEIITNVRQDAETNGETPQSPNPEPTPCSF